MRMTHRRQPDHTPAAPSQASADTLMRARRMSASSAIQPEHAGRAAGSRLDAPLPMRDHAASREAWRRSGRSRRGEGPLLSPPPRRAPPCWHMPYMKGAGGGDASLMGCSPGGIAAPNGVAWTWVRSPAVRERIILLFRPPILCMANPLNVWCTTVTDLVNTRRTTAEYDFRSCAPQPRSNRTARLYYTTNDR